MNPPFRKASTAAVPRFMVAVLVPVVLALQGAHSLAAEANSPVGLWKTFDDKTGSARAIVRIYEHDGKLFGKIEQSFKPGSESRVCAVCTDERKNQPIVGLLIIRNMQRTDDGWGGGDILDPESGAVYRCKFRLEQGGAKLIVRGFIGISLLGRTQIWEQQSQP